MKHRFASIRILDMIRIDTRSEATLAQQIKDQITWLIASNQLATGDQLPPIRQLASQLLINMNTVRSAYQKLEAEGLVESRQGRGTRVLLHEPGNIAPPVGLLRSHTIGIILPSFSNPFYHSFLQGVEEISRPEYCMLFVCQTHDNIEEAKQYFSQLAAKRVDGILIVSHDTSKIVSLPTFKRIPVVTADWPEIPGYLVEMNLENAGFLATRHLLEHGHKRVGLITTAIEYQNVSLVNSGYYKALGEAGIAPDPDLIVQVNGFDTSDGEEGVHKLLLLERAPSAIFAIADLLALGALRAIQMDGLKVPHDIAVVGFNDIPLGAFVAPQLTTVRAPTQAMGRAAMGMLQELIAGKEPVQRRIVLSTSLVIRQSCGEHILSMEKDTKEAIDLL